MPSGLADRIQDKEGGAVNASPTLATISWTTLGKAPTVWASLPSSLSGHVGLSPRSSGHPPQLKFHEQILKLPTFLFMIIQIHI